MWSLKKVLSERRVRARECGAQRRRRDGLHGIAVRDRFAARTIARERGERARDAEGTASGTARGARALARL